MSSQLLKRHDVFPVDSMLGGLPLGYGCLVKAKGSGQSCDPTAYFDGFVKVIFRLFFGRHSALSYGYVS